MNFGLILILGLIGLCLYLYFKFVKVPKCGSFNLVSGGVKTGKSSYCLALSLHYYKVARRKTFIYNHFLKYFDWHNPYWDNEEYPLLYSNIPLSVPYVHITRELLLRKKRFRKGSIVFIDEASLVADSMLFKDSNINNQLLLFCKLIGHELVSGKLFCNSQSISDLHYSFKRVASTYTYIYSVRKIPFLPLCLFQVRELFYSDDNSSMMNISTDDVEKSMRYVLTSSKYMKTFDSYCYSVLTDDLPVEEHIEYRDSSDLKSYSITSFRDYFMNLGENDET